MTVAVVFVEVLGALGGARGVVIVIIEKLLRSYVNRAKETVGEQGVNTVDRRKGQSWKRPLADASKQTLCYLHAAAQHAVPVKHLP